MLCRELWIILCLSFLLGLSIMYIALSRKRIYEQLKINNSISKNLTQKDALCENLAMSMPYGVFFVDKSGRLIFANEYWRKLTCFVNENISDIHWSDPFKSCSDNGLLDKHQQKLLSGESFTFETCIKSPDNTEKWLEISLTPIKNTFENIYGLGTLIDITRYKQLTLKLIEEHQKFETANLSRVEFLSNITHEIRTPLNGIIGMTQLLYSSPLDNEQRDLLSVIKSSSNTLLNTLNAILNFSKIESGEIEVINQPFKLHNLIISIHDCLKSVAEEKGLKLELSINPNVPQNVIGDSQKLSQILTDIISNAIKFTTIGKISVSVSLKSINNDKYEILFVVEDTGIGIPNEYLEQLFSYSMRINNTFANTVGGSGLSLVIIRELIKLLNGSIKVESEIDKGSTFSFMLPFGSHSSYIDELENSYENYSENLSENSNQTFRILLADDDLISQKLISKVATKQKWQLTVVSNGEDVLEVLKTQTFDLILMDIHMPKIDGHETTKMIRKQENDPHHIPIIAITANTLDFNIEKCQQAGIDDIIIKPILLSELVDKVNALALRPH